MLGRIANLPAANLEPPQFFANYLQLAAVATGSPGGAIWVVSAADQPPQCYCHLELDLARTDDPAQQRLLTEAVQRTVKEAKTLVVPAATEQIPAQQPPGLQNRCDHPMFFKPLRAGDKVAMVLHLIAEPHLSTEDFRPIVGLLEQIGQAAERYLTNRRAVVLEDDRRALARLLQYAQAVHNSLDPEKVVYQIANLGRDAIGCKRVVVWVDPQVKRGLRAVSGVDKPDRRAILMQSLEKLSRHCLKIKKPIVAARAQIPELPPDDPLTPLLTQYFHTSKLDQIFLEPVKGAEGFLGVLIAEGVDQADSCNVAGLVAAVGAHAGVALANALEMAAVPLLRPLARLQKVKSDPKKRRKWLIIAAVVVAGLALGALVPYPIRIDCSCELTPKHRRVIDAPLDGVQIIDVVKPSGAVQAGTIIMQLDDVELTTRLATLQGEKKQAQIRKNQARGSDVEYWQKEVDKQDNEITLVKTQMEKCRVRAPISGTIMTEQLERQAGLIVRKGDPLFEIADLTQWELLLNVPQEEIGWVQRGLEVGSGTVEFYLAAYPESKLQAEIVSAEQISQTAQTGDAGNVFEIRLDVPAAELSDLMVGLRSGSTGQAKIRTRDRALGYVLLRKVIRFFRVAFF